MPQLPDWKQVPSATAEAFERTRTQVGRAPRFVVDEIRRRINLLDLATRHDVAAQSKLARNRVSHVLNEFLEEQRARDDELRETLRAEQREELQSFVAAIADGILAMDSTRPAPPARDADLDDLLLYEEEDDEIDFTSLDDVDDPQSF